MARDFQINGATMISVKGNSTTTIASLSQLGLPASPIRVTPKFVHKDILVDAWGPEVPIDVQAFLAEVAISMDLIHVDLAVLDECLKEAMAGGSVALSPGAMPEAGKRMGGGFARFAAGNHYIGLNISSPVNSKPWRFLTTYLTGPPMEVPLGTEKSIYTLNWRAIPYAVDPWGAGVTSSGVYVWDYTLDT